MAPTAGEALATKGTAGAASFAVRPPARNALQAETSADGVVQQTGRIVGTQHHFAARGELNVQRHGFILGYERNGGTCSISPGGVALGVARLAALSFAWAKRAPSVRACCLDDRRSAVSPSIVASQLLSAVHLCISSACFSRECHAIPTLSSFKSKNMSAPAREHEPVRFLPSFGSRSESGHVCSALLRLPSIRSLLRVLLGATIRFIHRR